MFITMIIISSSSNSSCIIISSSSSIIIQVSRRLPRERGGAGGRADRRPRPVEGRASEDSGHETFDDNKFESSMLMLYV